MPSDTSFGLINIQNKSNYTQTYSNVGKGLKSLRLFITGDLGDSGLIKFEMLMPDATWQSFPSLTFRAIDSYYIQMPYPYTFRVVIQDCVDVSVFAPRQDGNF